MRVDGTEMSGRLGWVFGGRFKRLAAHGMSERAAGRTPVMGADETIVKAGGKAKLVGFASDAKSGKPLGIDILVERDGDGFANWLKGYVERLGVEAVVTDDLSTYNPAVAKCERLVRMESRLRGLLDELPDDGGKRLMDMERVVREGACAASAGGGLMGEVAQAAVPQARTRRVRYEQCDRASDRQEQSKIQGDTRL